MALPFPIIPLLRTSTSIPSTKPLNSSPYATLNRNNSPATRLSSTPPVKKRCLRCTTLYQQEDSSLTACSFHGHTTVFAGERGLLAMAPPHQGIDGEWSDGSGVIVYKWNERGNRPNSGSGNWKRRWSCCGEYGESASPCRRGWHVCYDDGFTLY